MLFCALDVSVVDNVEPYIIFKNRTKSPKLNPWFLDLRGDDGDLVFGDFLLPDFCFGVVSSR